jgi:hypothetical protein
VSDLVDVRVIGTFEAAVRACSRLVPLFESYRQSGPYPSSKRPDQVRYYVTGRLWPHAVAPGDPGERDEWLYPALLRIRKAITAALEDETADRQSALEQADSRLANLIGRWRASVSPAAALAPREAGR